MHHRTPRGRSELGKITVTLTAQAPAVARAHPPHEREALLLAELLRSSRLALLYAEAGSDKSTLLTDGLIPLLSRRMGDHLAPAAVRLSGVVVPFPDRRGRPSLHSSKRRREIVVYCEDWTGAPLTALRESLYEAVSVDRAHGMQGNAPLGSVLEDLSQRFDAHFILLLDRFEDLLLASSDDPAIVQFANEIAEAINRPQLPASFLIALAEEAKPNLAGLRARIAGFDDSSLKLAPLRDINKAMIPTEQQHASASAVVEALPILTDTVNVAAPDAMPAPRSPLEPAIRTSAMRKSKQPPLPRVEIRTEDVYMMIEAALTRIAMNRRCTD